MSIYNAGGGGGNSATNLVNGSATGSLRSIGSAAESSSYTIGENAIALGSGTKASGERSHAEGSSAIASGYGSHAEGSATTASGEYSHAEGVKARASGKSSHAEGYYTIAQRLSQTAIGEYNIADTTGADGSVRGSYAFIIGNGTASDARSNALAVDWSGNLQIAGTVKNMSGNDLITKVQIVRW